MRVKEKNKSRKKDQKGNTKWRKKYVASESNVIQQTKMCARIL